jgi:2-oxoacid:acceptor oxidoreductase gamma subunit (pyruvate/2-ketoisovalerate family)
MIEIRFHGRGGQGAVIASKALAIAFFHEGKHVQAFPSFGVERRGAPVTAFTRVDDHPIRLRNFIYTPDHIIILDATLIASANVTEGLKKNGWILINTDAAPSKFRNLSKFRVATVDADSIAVEYKLGTPTSPIVNTAILGAFSKIAGIVSLDSVLEGIRDTVPSNKAGNASAAKEASLRVLT